MSKVGAEERRSKAQGAEAMDEGLVGSRQALAYLTFPAISPED